MPVSAHARHQRVPVAGVQRRETEALGQLGERHRVEPPRRVAPHLAGRELRVEQPGQLAGDDAARVRARPLLEVPVVGSPHDREREVGIAHAELVALARETGERRREVQGRVDAVEVHVAHARIDVPRAASHLVEADGVERQLLLRPAHDRVEADLVVAVAVVQPVLHAVVVGLDTRRALGVLGGDPALEEVGWLDEVVVDRDQRAPAGPAIGVGQEGDVLRPSFAGRLGGEEPGPGLEIVEVDARAGHGPLRRSRWSPVDGEYARITKDGREPRHRVPRR